MNKFTIFTIILSISVITVAADLAVREYFDEGIESPPQAMIQDAGGEIEDEGTDREVRDSQVSVLNAEPKTPVFTLPPPSTYLFTITQNLINKAGFESTVFEKHFDGKVFQLLDITAIPIEAAGLYEIKKDNAPIASVTEIALQDEIRALQLYMLLQNKTKPYIDLSLNETNAYGDRSFYINHGKKPEEAFLTVKIGKVLYAFAYVKTYHPQIKKLIELLTF